MAFWIELSLFVTGVLLLVIGYRKNRRDLLVIGAIALYVSAAPVEFAEGIIEGFRSGYVE
ncbi:MAG: hypothetical protein ACK4E7_03875 [Permianibacter sp.]